MRFHTHFQISPFSIYFGVAMSPIGSFPASLTTGTTEATSYVQELASRGTILQFCVTWHDHYIMRMLVLMTGECRMIISWWYHGNIIWDITWNNIGMIYNNNGIIMVIMEYYHPQPSSKIKHFLWINKDWPCMMTRECSYHDNMITIV